MKPINKRRLIYWAPSGLALIASAALTLLAAYANASSSDDGFDRIDPRIQASAQGYSEFNGNGSPLTSQPPAYAPELKAKMEAVMNTCPVDPSLKTSFLFRYSEAELPSPNLFDVICSMLVLPPPTEQKHAAIEWREFTQKVSPILAEIQVVVDDSKPQNERARFVFEQAVGKPHLFQLTEVQKMKVKGSTLERTFIFQMQQTVAVYYELIASYVNQKDKPQVDPIRAIPRVSSPSTGSSTIQMLTPTSR